MMVCRTADPPDARQHVEAILEDAITRCASDVHLEPTSAGCEVRLRIDGLMQTATTLDAAHGRSLVARLMVMAQLLTYRQDIPQEGRATLALPRIGRMIEARVAIMPTTHGLRAAVRLPADFATPRTLDTLGLPDAVMAGLNRYTHADSGLLLLTGPAGSGKTTTIYALLEHIRAASPGLSLISLEDPVERDLPGVTQIEVQPFGELTYERALRSMLRQDPQVLALGEIRDSATAALAVQAALSGHRIIATLHAGSPAGAVARLLEMGIEPYQATSALFGVVALRLLRKRTEQGGYRGRAPAAEIALLTPALRQAILRKADSQELAAAIAQAPGHQTLRDAAGALVAAGVTDEAELMRVMGNE
jgi:general secretion pathway protein E